MERPRLFGLTQPQSPHRDTPTPAAAGRPLEQRELTGGPTPTSEAGASPSCAACAQSGGRGTSIMCRRQALPSSSSS